MDPLTQLSELSIDPKDKPRFLDLPGEIRNQIYSLLVPSFPREIHVSAARTSRARAVGETLSVLPQPSLKPIPLAGCFPGIAFANKQVYGEIVPIMVARTRFVVQSNADAHELDRFLDYSNTRGCVQSLAFPQISRPDQGSTYTQSHVFQSCEDLRELSLGVDSEAVMPFFKEPETEASKGKVSVLWCWGLPRLECLPKLEKFRMQCEIKPGQAMTIDAFENIAGWVDLHFRDDVVVLEDGRIEDREVRKRHLKFNGLTGLLEMAVWSWTIVRKQ